MNGLIYGRFDTKQISSFNVSYVGQSFSNGIPYQVIILQEFDTNDKPIGDAKTLYVKQTHNNKSIISLPEIDSVDIIKKLMKFPNHSRLEINANIKFRRETQK